MKTLYVLLTWFGIILAVSLAGVFDSPPGKPPLPLLLAVALPLLFYSIDRWILNGTFLGAIQKMESSNTIFLQTERIVGFAFLVEYAKGHLPSGFALPAGLGDVAIGLAAPWVAYNLVLRKKNAVKIARVWNYLGIFDLIVAVSMGITHGGPPLGIFAQATSMQPITHYPLCLIPGFFVPLALIMHLRSLQSLRETSEATQTSRGGGYGLENPVAV